MNDFRNKKITIVGLGERTGVSLLRYLSKGGAKIFVTEAREKEEVLAAWNQVSGLDAEFEFGGHSIERVGGSDLAILCPGVPLDSQIVKDIAKLGIETVSELEFSSRLIGPGKVIGVTGTNGKSTTVMMLGEILREWGPKTFVGGNIGSPLVDALVAGDGFDFYVVEVSTFQLEAVKSFRPHVGVLLNISRNHLDRHKSMEAYAALKLKLFEKQMPDDVAVLNADDASTISAGSRISSRKLLFGTGRDADLFYEEGKIKGNVFGSRMELSLEGFSMRGEHNIANLMAASAVASVLGCPAGKIETAMVKFKPLPHRIEYVCQSGQVKYFDDSKSTTVDSTRKALKSIDGRLVLIAGGRDKGSEFSELASALNGRLRGVVLYGEAGTKMAKALAGVTSVYREKGFDEAVLKARDIAEPGDSVLLSPANSSFDLFTDYKERGRRFKKIVSGFTDGKE